MTSASVPSLDRPSVTGSSSSRRAAESVPMIRKLRGSPTSAVGVSVEPTSTTGMLSNFVRTVLSP